MKLKNKIFFILIFLLPPFVMNVFHASSYSSGILLLCLIFFINFFLSKKSSFLFKSNKNFIRANIVLYLMLLHGIIWMLIINSFNFNKFIFSYIGISFILLNALLFGSFFKSQKDNHVNKILKITLFILFLNSLFPLFGIKLYNSSVPVGLFVEPSHFALALSPLLLYSVIDKIKYFKLYLIYFAFWAVFIQNLTLLLVVFGCFIFNNSKKNILYAIIIISLSSLVINISYFTSRTNLSSNSNNLSVLVFLNGWQKAAEAFKVSNGLGVGFQQLGYYNLKEDNSINEALAVFEKDHLNKYDAGSLAPKIIAEFGIFGILLIIAYLIYFKTILIDIRNNRHFRSKSILFMQICSLTLILELFFRGVGYFSTSVFLFLLCITNMNLSDLSRALKK